MLEHLPRWLGHALATLRAGSDNLAIASLYREGLQPVRLTSPAFADGGRIPDRFTADGPGTSPPLTWGPLPDGTEALALLVEDADAPLPSPLVHALAWDIDPLSHDLDEGAIGNGSGGHEDGAPETGRNSYQKRGWLPPDPPPGHGEHRYVFQLFAMSERPALGASPGRSALMEAIGPSLLGAGVLTGTYSRDDPAAVGPAAAAVPSARPPR